jgi:hypothetical protein
VSINNLSLLIRVASFALLICSSYSVANDFNSEGIFCPTKELCKVVKACKKNKCTDQVKQLELNSQTEFGDPFLLVTFPPQSIFSGESIGISWFFVDAPFATCTVTHNSIEIGRGTISGSLVFKLFESGLLKIKCTYSKWTVEDSVYIDVKKGVPPTPEIIISGPSSLHAYQVGEFSWQIRNASKCIRTDNVSNLDTDIAATSGSARIAWGGPVYQSVTLSIECSGDGGRAVQSHNVYIIPEAVEPPIKTEIKLFQINVTSPFKATGSWITTNMASCTLSSNYAGSYNNFPVPVNTPIGGYSGVNVAGTTLEVFTLNCKGKDGKDYQKSSSPY